MNDFVTVVGAGLAGCEAAWQLVRRGIPVHLIEMKPNVFSPAHHMAGFAELVCSNSLKSEQQTNASGLLKAEMKKLDSLILSAAEASRVPAGAALAVDREDMSARITETLSTHPLVTVCRETTREIPPVPAIIATGPLTEAGMAAAILRLDGFSALHFFDAAAPIITADSLDMTKIFRASRFDEGGDYLNCPMDEARYDAFYRALIAAEVAPLHDFEKKMVFEGCLAVEILASRGRDTLAFGPLKPIGLVDPVTGKRPYAVVQLRQDNESGTLYNMVGFQTRLKWGEQKRVFGMIPGLENAEFARYGVMHKNTYLNSPDVLAKNYAVRGNPLLRFAGQMTGVEGYMESAASGMTAAIGLACAMTGKEEPDFTGQTILGALTRHTTTRTANFQPMNANFGILDMPETRIRAKKERYQYLADRSLHMMDALIAKYQIG